jgi:hypothetical protein
MELRKTFSEKPAIAAGVGGGLLLIALVCIGWQLRGPTAPDGRTSAFFSVDDGKTWFKDDVSKLAPFDVGGKEAVRAHVFRSASGKEFVNHLERLKSDAKRVLEEAKKKTSTSSLSSQSAVQDARMNGREVKRPGDAKWISTVNPREAGQILTVNCPDGGTDATPVEP